MFVREGYFLPGDQVKDSLVSPETSPVKALELDDISLDKSLAYHSTVKVEKY